MKTWRLKRTRQCKKCPWKKSTNPHAIPNGYCPAKHAALEKTIAREGDFTALMSDTIHIMACHETHDAHCVGWLSNQLGPGNNIPLRLQMRNCENAGEIRLDGEQHQSFADTLPHAGYE